MHPALLAACESTDQLIHRQTGYWMTRDLVRWTDCAPAVAHVMRYARGREDLQHPDECKKGCQRDLRNWRRGAEAGCEVK